MREDHEYEISRNPNDSSPLNPDAAPEVAPGLEEIIPEIPPNTTTQREIEKGILGVFNEEDEAEKIRQEKIREIIRKRDAPEKSN